MFLLLFIVFILVANVNGAPWPKRGLVFMDSNLIKGFNFPGSQVNWAYNWYSSTSNFSHYLEYIPMLSSSNPFSTTQWNSNAARAIGTGSGHLLFFNEPDCVDGANVKPVDAAKLYMQYMQPFKDRAVLGGPAVSAGPSGILWLTQFLDTCNSLGCRIDFIPFHWYGSVRDVEGFKNYIKLAITSARGRQIWITEFSAAGSAQQQADFMRTILPWMDQQPLIYRYSWNGAFINELVNSDGSITTLGKVYGSLAY